jgi:hypothetical protein
LKDPTAVDLRRHPPNVILAPEPADAADVARVAGCRESSLSKVLGVDAVASAEPLDILRFFAEDRARKRW